MSRYTAHLHSRAGLHRTRLTILSYSDARSYEQLQLSGTNFCTAGVPTSPVNRTKLLPRDLSGVTSFPPQRTAAATSCRHGL